MNSKVIHYAISSAGQKGSIPSQNHSAEPPHYL